MSWLKRLFERERRTGTLTCSETIWRKAQDEETATDGRSEQGSSESKHAATQRPLSDKVEGDSRGNRGGKEQEQEEETPSTPATKTPAQIAMDATIVRRGSLEEIVAEISCEYAERPSDERKAKSEHNAQAERCDVHDSEKGHSDADKSRRTNTVVRNR